MPLPPAGFFMSCPFPGDLFAQFPKLQTLLAGWNSFTVRCAVSCSALRCAALRRVGAGRGRP